MRTRPPHIGSSRTGASGLAYQPIPGNLDHVTPRIAHAAAFRAVSAMPRSARFQELPVRTGLRELDCVYWIACTGLHLCMAFPLRQRPRTSLMHVSPLGQAAGREASEGTSWGRPPAGTIALSLDSFARSLRRTQIN